VSKSPEIRTQPVRPLDPEPEAEEVRPAGEVREKPRPDPVAPLSLDPETEKGRKRYALAGDPDHEFSCPVIGCGSTPDTRSFKISQSQVRYVAKYDEWLCCEDHRNVYVLAMDG